MSHISAWNALADRFAAIAADSAIELTDHPPDPDPFDTELIRSRVLFRYRPDEAEPDERVYSIRSEGPDPYVRRMRVNRFRWVCWAAGVLLDPHACYRCGEVVWLNHLVGNRPDTIRDIAGLSVEAARNFARQGNSPPPAPPVARPEWWPNQRTLFGVYARRFESPHFHGASLRMTVGQRFLPGDEGTDPDWHAYDWERRGRFRGRPWQLEYFSDLGGTIWGDRHAVREFNEVADSAARSLPSELTIGMGPPLFPPVTFGGQTDLGQYWNRWAVIMWTLCPSSFTTEMPSPQSHPALTATGCLEAIAAMVCNRIATTEDCHRLKRDVRLQLACGNPWLTHEDRRAARQAIEAAYSPAAENAQPPGRRPSATQQPPILPKWDDDERTLSYGDREVKRYRRNAPNQFALFQAFERLGWPASINNPIPSKDLNATVRDVNNSLGDNSPIRLRMNGTGSGVRWMLKPLTRTANSRNSRSSSRRSP